MSSKPTNEISRTPARGLTLPSPLTIPSPPHSPTPAVKTTTRSDTAKASYLYVSQDGETPSGTDWEHYIVKLGADITELEGPVYGIIGERSTTRSKGRKKQSQQAAYTIREMFEGTIGSETYTVEKGSIEFVTRENHEKHLENLMYRHGRILNYVGLIEYVQVIGISTDLTGSPDGLIVLKRGDLPSEDNRMNLDENELKVCSILEYITDYGSGFGKTKQKKVNQTGALLTENILTSTDFIGYQGKSKVNFTIDCDMGEELTYLTEVGEWKQITPEEYMLNEVFGLEEKEPVKVAPVKPKTREVKKKEIFVKPGKTIKLKKALFTDTEVNSESDADEEPEPDPIDDFVVATPITMVPKVTTTNKFAIVVTGTRLQRHEAIINQDLLGGKLKGMPIETRADRIFRMESKRANYDCNRTSFQIWFFGNFGEDPISYFLPYEKVPTNAAQAIPNEKWTTSVHPSRWILSMNDLSECLSTLSEIAHEYFRYDVYTAIEAIAKKARIMHDLDLAMAGVNAYRDLYGGALSAIVDGAVEGFKGDSLLQLALGQVHPSSKPFSDIINDRLQRVNAGAQWGKSGGGKKGEGKIGNGKGSGGKVGDGKGGEDKKGMSEAQKDLVPSVDGRKVCLAFMSVKSCKRDDCLFLHDTSKEVPDGLRNYFRKRFGAVKPKDKQ